MFKIHDRPIRTYVASAPQSSVKPLNTSTFSFKPNAEPIPLELLPLTVSFQTPSRCLRVPQTLLILINVHLLILVCKSSIELNRYYRGPLLNLKKDLSKFFKKVGYVSDQFFNSALTSTNVFLQTNTFPAISKDLPHLCSFASFFGAEIQSVFLHVDGSFIVEEFLNFSNVISGLELTLENHNDLEFLNKSSLIFPGLKQLDVCLPCRSPICLPLIDLLKVNTTVTNIVINNNSIGAESARALADALTVNATITSIDLLDNSIEDEGARALAEALMVNATITSINLDNNSIGAEGARALAEALKVNTILTAIGLFSNSIGYEGSRALAEALKVNTTVTSIDLFSNSIGDEGATAFAEALKVNTTVTSIDLFCNSIGDEGATALAEALKVNTTVTSVALVNNYIEDVGAKALAEALKVNTTVTLVDLSHNYIEDEGARVLTEASKVNSIVKIVY
ncbi:hypothetical protein GEMRC1_009789 [Eukaryota sp. GEM-RC1]